MLVFVLVDAKLHFVAEYLHCAINDNNVLSIYIHLLVDIEYTSARGVMVLGKKIKINSNRTVLHPMVQQVLAPRVISKMATRTHL